MTIPNSGHLATPDDLTTVARRAEELGFHSVWVTDHVALPVENSSTYPYSADGRVTWDVGVPWLDVLVSLTWVAAVTERVRLGTSVMILPMRPALLVAKMAASVDVLSGGRLVLGLGSGWLAEEFALLEQSFDDRGPRMTDAIRLLRQCWSEGPVTPSGDFVPSIPFMMAPGPVQGPNVPMLIGGHSDAALRRVAEVGDGWHPTNRSPAQVDEGLARIKRYAEQANRPWSDFTVAVRPGGRVPVTKELAEEYASVGASLLVADVDYRSLSLDHSLDTLESLAEELNLVR